MGIPLKSFLIKFKKLLLSILKDTYTTSLVLFKIMIPVSIVVKILQETGAIVYVGMALAPLMKLVGLPGEMGVVWASGMIANIYGGILAFFNLSSHYPLTVAQMTVLTTMILIAHTFPIELQVARKAGIRMTAMFAIRFGFAMVYGMIMNFIYSTFNLLQQPSVISWKPNRPIHLTLDQWILSELKNYVYILIIIFCLIILMKILKEAGIINWMNKLLKPVLGILGISETIIPISIIGLTLGVSYGGAIIIQESKKLPFNKRDIFYSFVLMGLCHSMIEDTLLMISVGGHYSGVLIGRLIFAFLITWLTVRITRRLSDETMMRYFLLAEKRKKN